MDKPSVAQMAAELKLSFLNCCDDQAKLIETNDIHRPALEVAGFFNYYPARRVQVLGQTEHEFFTSLARELQQQRVRQLVHEETPCFIFSRNLVPPSILMEMARARNVPVLGTSLPTTSLISRLGHWLDNRLAPRITMHGVLIELFGVGVLITGKSGIGKSETVLELIKRGHRLVADDAVEIRRPSAGVVVGASPAVLTNLMELRGVGIIDVVKLFGAGAVRPDKRVELVLEFEQWQEGANYDRLGLDVQYQSILDVKVPYLKVPVAPGRNLAIIVEAAAVNYRAKAMGVDTGKDLTERITKAQMNQ